MCKFKLLYAETLAQINYSSERSAQMETKAAKKCDFASWPWWLVCLLSSLLSQFHTYLLFSISQKYLWPSKHIYPAMPIRESWSTSYTCDHNAPEAEAGTFITDTHNFIINLKARDDVFRIRTNVHFSACQLQELIQVTVALFLRIVESSTS